MAHKYFRMANQQNQQKDIHFAMAQYLLDMGPMPPPHPEEYTAAMANAALNSGVFEGHNAQLQQPILPAVIIQGRAQHDGK